MDIAFIVALGALFLLYTGVLVLRTINRTKSVAAVDDARKLRVCDGRKVNS